MPRLDRRRLIVTTILFGVLLAPALASVAFGFGAGGVYLVIGTIAVLPVGFALDRQSAVWAALVATFAAAVVLALGSDPWVVGGWMALLGLAVGVTATRGVESVVAGGAMAAALLTGGGAEAWAPLAILVGGAYGALVAGILTHGGQRPRVSLDAQRAVRYALVLGIGLGLLTAVPLALGVPHGYWAPVTVLALAAPWPTLTTGRAAERVVGTLVGALLALLLAVVLPTPGVLVTLAIVTGFAGVYYLELHARRTALLTAAIVLLGGSGGAADATALTRIATVGAAVVVVIATALVLRRATTPTASLVATDARTG